MKITVMKYETHRKENMKLTVRRISNSHEGENETHSKEKMKLTERSK